MDASSLSLVLTIQDMNLLYGFTTLMAFMALSAFAVAATSNPAKSMAFNQHQTGEAFPAGDATYRKTLNKKAFTHPLANLPLRKQLDFRLGHSIFKKIWVSSPSSTTASDGLGPLFNARSCLRCHIRDGRGHPPEETNPNDNAVSMFLRLSIPPQTAQQQQAIDQGRLGLIPEPTYGQQLQDFAVQGLPIEGNMVVRYQPKPITLADGEVVTLRQPEYSVSNLGFGPLHPETMLSPRVAPPMIGLGFLEAINSADILAWQDPNDSNNDGISGKANIVWDQKQQQSALGRFGWKAGNPNLEQQNNSALNGDIGISNPSFTNHAGDCLQPICLNAPNGNTAAQDGLEASKQMVDLLLFYTRTITVPVRKNAKKPEVLAGKAIFYKAGCQQCHRASYKTPTDTVIPELANQTIWPYSDLLLHDMGEGLADNRPEFLANGREWRTPPLWGLSMTKTVSGHSYLLHDGRARNILEAILWHGGEATAAKDAVVNLTKAERNALISFLESL